MRNILMALSGVAVLLSPGVAAAKGHLVGAAAGAAIAPKHHRVAGAVVGGAVGHHMAKAKAKPQPTPR